MKKALFSFIFLLALTVVLAPSQSKASYLENSLDLNNLGENATIKEITYEEYLAEVAKATGVSEEEVAKESEDLKQFSINKGVSINNSTSSLCTNCSLNQIEITQNVKTFYKPAIQIYAVIYNSGSFRQFNEIRNIILNREYKGVVKQFDGAITAEINKSTQLYYIIDGDFRDYGKTTLSFSYDVGSKTGKANFNFSGSYEPDNLYKYWNNYDYYSLY